MRFNLKYRYVLVFLFDMFAVACALLLAYFLRFNFSILSVLESKPNLFVPVILLSGHWLACWFFKLHKGLWYFASITDTIRMIKVALSSALLLIILDVILRANMPRSVFVIYPLLLVVIMGGARFVWRVYKDFKSQGKSSSKLGKPVVVLGAGSAGAMLVRELGRTVDWHVVGLLDDDRRKWGLEIMGKRILGGFNELPEVLKEYQVHNVIMAMPASSKDTLLKMTELVAKCKANIFTVPGLTELMSGRVAINKMRPVKIDDLLGREPVSIESENLLKMINDKVVMVTGAGGSIGSELCRQLARFRPKVLLLLENSEYALYKIDQWFLEYYPDLQIIPLAADVRDRIRIEEIFEKWNPQLIMHAAAYKHVPLMEQNNSWQAVKNNVLGTLNVVSMAQKYNAERFVLISTDKAVNPTNVMGATKRMAEMVCEHLHRLNNRLIVNIVRFGNVLGSTGSVIPKFKEQISRGGPVTVTHPDINRFFMSIPEAAQLVLQASSMGRGGEIFVLDMGDPVKIVDLARNMIRLSGFSEDEIRIEYTGLRPGEKLYEELLADSEETRKTPHPKLRIARSRPVPVEFYDSITIWLRADKVVDNEVKVELKKWIPEYKPGL